MEQLNNLHISTVVIFILGIIQIPLATYSENRLVWLNLLVFGFCCGFSVCRIVNLYIQYIGWRGLRWLEQKENEAYVVINNKNWRW